VPERKGQQMAVVAGSCVYGQVRPRVQVPVNGRSGREGKEKGGGKRGWKEGIEGAGRGKEGEGREEGEGGRR
jgi:hypothetical protein